jgi:dTDP-4-dehydrorhamnose 3,5-epimerase
MIKIIETAISDVVIIVPDLFADARGFFFESYNAKDFSAIIGSDISFVQDNHSRSIKNVLRGLHYQVRHPQGKLIRVIAGEIYDVAVDLRKSSATFGRHVACRLSAENHHMLWVPPYFAHGFLALSPTAEVLYKTTDFYSPKDERCLRWDDPDLAINWPNNGKVLLSAKDQQGSSLKEAEVFP